MNPKPALLSPFDSSLDDLLKPGKLSGTVCTITEGIPTLAAITRARFFGSGIGEAGWKGKSHPNDLTRTWGVRSSASGPVRLAEAPLEREVSTYIGQMPFLWINVPDEPSRNSDRAYLELNSIALLSNFERSGIDSPSPHWLGLQSSKITIRESGLWNTNHVEKFHDPMFLVKLRSTSAERLPDIQVGQTVGWPKSLATGVETTETTCTPPAAKSQQNRLS